jgi:hypothetical protein
MALQEMNCFRENFDAFQPFIHTHGLDKATSDAFLQYLRVLYSQTGKFWFPGLCPLITSEESVAIATQLIDTQAVLSQTYIVTPQRYLDLHSWLALQGLNEEPRLIIDPTGVPSSLNSLKKIIIPHFGLIKLAHPFAQQVYTKSENLN